MTNLIENSPDILDYVWVYECLNDFEVFEEMTKKNIKEKIFNSQKENFDLEVNFTNQNLKELGIDKTISPNYNEYKSKKTNELIDKQFQKFDRTIKNQLLNMLNTQNINEVKNLLETMIKNEKKTNNIVNKLMRVYRTENTAMRSKVKLDIQEELKNEGIEVKRRWVHTLGVATNRVSSNYTPREDHLALNGVVEDSRGYFHTFTGYSGKGPGLFGVPEEDINCRCDVDFIL